MNKIAVLLGITLLLASFAYSAPELSWALDNSAIDEIGGKPGYFFSQTYNSTEVPTYGVSGDGGSHSVMNDGFSSWFEANESYTDMTVTNQSFSFSLWIWPNTWVGNGKDKGRVIQIGQATGPTADNGYLYLTSGGGLDCFYRDQGGSAIFTISNITVTKTAWSHIGYILDHDAKTLCVSFNGVVQGCATYSNADRTDFHGSWTFGGSRATDWSPLVNIDEIRFWSHPLTTAQLLDDYENGYSSGGAPGDSVEYNNTLTPGNNTHWNSLGNVSINVSQNCNLGGESSIYFGIDYPPSEAILYNVSGLNISNVTADNTYFYYAECTTNSSANTSIRTIVLDTSAPGFTGTFAPVEGSKKGTADFLYFAQSQDTHIYNLSLVIRNGSQVFLDLANSTPTGDTLKITGIVDSSALGMFSGPYNFSANSWDSHTAKYYNFKSVVKEWTKLSLNTDTSYLWIQTDEGATFDAVHNFDRYNWSIYYTDKTKKKRTILVTASVGLTYLPDSEYKGHFITQDLQNWIDFECYTEEEGEITPDEIKKKDKYSFEVVYNEVEGDIFCRSAGGLNHNSYNYTFYLDIGAPIVTNITPAYGVTYNETNTINFIYSVSDTYGNVSNCELLINGSNVETDYSITEGINQTFAKQLANGDYIYSVNCTDQSSNEGGSPASLFSINYSVPTLAIHSIGFSPVRAVNYTDLSIWVNGSYANSSTTVGYQYLIFKNGAIVTDYFKYNCYQEFANDTLYSQGICELNTGGSYTLNDKWTRAPETHDGLFATDGTVDNSPNKGTMAINYTAPTYYSGALAISKAEDLTTNATVGGNIISNYLAFFINLTWDEKYFYGVYNGADYDTLSTQYAQVGFPGPYDGQDVFSEEAVLWKTPPTALNVPSYEKYNLYNLSKEETQAGDVIIVSVRAYHEEGNYSSWTNSSALTIENLTLGACTDNAYNFTAINISYYDELTLATISATNEFYLTLAPPLYGVSSNTLALATSSTICTSLNISQIGDFNIKAYGSMNINAPGYGQGILENDLATAYDVTDGPVYLSAYLIPNANASAVTFTTKNSANKGVISGVLVKMYQLLNGTPSLVQSKLTGVTGTARLPYVAGKHYLVNFSRSGYNVLSANFNPITSSTYDILMVATVYQNTSEARTRVSVSPSPTTYAIGQNNFSIKFYSPYEEFNSYSYKLTYPTGEITGSGVNPSGQTFARNITITDPNVFDLVTLNVTYNTPLTGSQTFIYNYEITPGDGNYTMMKNKEKTYGLGLFERLFVSTIIVIFFVGISALMGAITFGSFIGFALWSYFVYIGFLPLWSILISVFAGIIIISGRSP